METKKIISFFIVLLFLLTSCSTGNTFLDDIKFKSDVETNNIVDEVDDNISIEVYFCPREDCEGELLNFLKQSEYEIKCAFFDFRLKEVEKVLYDKNALLILDHRYFDELHYYNASGSNLIIDNQSALMHNKMCVVDGEYVFTGSFNPTENGAYKNNNNMLIIHSRKLAKNYLKEIDEWIDDDKYETPYPYIEMDEIQIKSYFCPEDNCGEAVVEEIKKANESIYFMTFSFTHNSIANNILLKYDDGVEVKGIFESRQAGSKYSKYHVMEYQDIDVMKDGNKYNMHHKVFIIDNETVITGSFNPSNNGDKRNDENIVIIKDKKVAKEFLEEFELIYNETKNTI